MIMSDTIPPRVFDSVTAAVANSQPPQAPPYADVPESAPTAAKSPRKTAAKKATPKPVQEDPAKVAGTVVQAGAAGVKAKAHGTK